ncbi:MAG TPA: hypothetical protein VM680_09435 [Verrucomicrobiae bacterium]|nr:hypothetical protein [Verrucomicrobiae bacterium]
MERGLPTETQELIQRNQTQEARLREKLAGMGGELKPQRRVATKSSAGPQEAWRVPGLNRDVRVDIKVAATEEADWAAGGVARALESCGFATKIKKDASCTWEGIHVESRTEQAGAALLIQGAFRNANIGAGLTIHDRAAAKRIIVHVGARGLW